MPEQETRQALLSAIPEALPEIILVVSKGTVVYANSACRQFAERASSHVPGCCVSSYLPPSFVDTIAALENDLRFGASSASKLWNGENGNGQDVSYYVQACSFEYDNNTATLIRATEVTSLCAAGCNFTRINCSLRVLCEIDSALIHQRTENSFLRSACVSLVNTGKHGFAWVGYVSGGGPEPLIQPVASYGIRRREAERLASARSRASGLQSPSAVAVARGVPVVVDDIASDDGFALPAFADTRYVSSLDIPIRDKSRVLGVLSIYDSQPNRFGEEEIALYSRLAENLAYGIKSIRNRAALQHTLDQTNTLSRQLMRSQEQVRQHLSREIHDQLGSLTTGILMSLNQCEQVCTGVEDNGIAGVNELVLELIHGVRNLSQTLRPPMLDDFGLLPTIEWYVEKFGERAGIQVHLKHRGISQRMDPDIEITVFRLLQEALTNIARHADTDRAWVSIVVGRGQVRVAVQDEGRGFDVAATQRTTTSTGLTGMRERAALLGGSLTIDSAPGRGTRIAAIIPTIQMNKGELLW